MFGWSFWWCCIVLDYSCWIESEQWQLTRRSKKHFSCRKIHYPIMGAMTIHNSVNLLSSSAGSSAEQETPFFSLKSGAKRAHHFSFDLRQSWHLLMWRAGRETKWIMAIISPYRKSRSHTSVWNMLKPGFFFWSNRYTVQPLHFPWGKISKNIAEITRQSPNWCIWHMLLGETPGQSQSFGTQQLRNASTKTLFKTTCSHWAFPSNNITASWTPEKRTLKRSVVHGGSLELKDVEKP